jgi:cyanate lyase
MTTAKEFVDFWLDVSVHADEQEGPRQAQAAVQHLADNLINAARDQGFSKEQVESELGDDLEAYIRASIDRQNVDEATRLRNETALPEVK